MSRVEPPYIDTPWQFSVSQVENFRLCNRKWAWEKIDGIKPPPNESAALGQLVHEQLEGYLEHGNPIDASKDPGKIALSGVQHLPLPKTPGMTVERGFSIKIGRAAFRGYKDFEILRLPLSSFLQENFGTLRVPLVGDHKTTKNFQWAKTPKDLQTGVQSGIYAYDAHKETGERLINLLWVYYRTKGPKTSFKVETTISLPQIMSVIEQVEETSELMIQTKLNHETAKTVPQNLAGCDAFGGCFFKGKCGLTAQSKLISLFKQKDTEMQKANNAILAKLQKQKQEQQNQEPLAGDTQVGGTKTVAPVAAPELVNQILEAADEQINEIVESVKINPPESELPDPEPEAPAEAPVHTGTRKAKPGKKAAAKEAAASVLNAQGGFFTLLDALLDEIAERVAEKLGK